MKRIFIMLLIACTAITATNVHAQRKQTDNRPKNVIHTLGLIINECGNENGEVYNVTRNPNTNLIEFKDQRVHFTCSANNPNLLQIGNRFKSDEGLCYQFLHIAKGSNEKFSIVTYDNEKQRFTDTFIRKRASQEMWFMATKNSVNPRLRDVYAIVWSPKEDNSNMVEGDIFMITSPRPDLYEIDMESSSKTFKIDGRVGYDLNDSLYVFYMADTYEELNDLVKMTDSYEELKKLGDNAHVAYMPVKNKHFGISVEIDKHKAGRIRTVMPDGSLCKLWTNIDMVPGETYRITTHNGYFDEDRDYEHRFGRYSDKSMIKGHDYDDLEITGGYTEEDTVVIDDPISNGIKHVKPMNGSKNNDNPLKGLTAEQIMDLTSAVTLVSPLKGLTAEQIMDLELMAASIEQSKEMIEDLFETVTEGIGNMPFYGKPKKWEPYDNMFNTISIQNKNFDKLFDNLLNTCSKYGLKQKDLLEPRKLALELLMEQSKAFNEYYMKYGYLSTAAAKCQKQVNKLIEKHMKAMSKAMGLTK